MANKYPRIKETREEANMGQAEMAKLLHTSKSAYIKWEHGERNFPNDSLILFADILDVAIDYLLDRSNNKTLINKKKK